MPSNPLDVARQFATQQLGGLTTNTGGISERFVAQNRLAAEPQQEVQLDPNSATARARTDLLKAAVPKATGMSGADYRQAKLQQSIKNTQARKAREAEAARVKAAQEAAARAKAAQRSGGNFAASGNITGTRGGIVGEAASYLGNRYVMGGNTHAGIDCSGLVQQVYRKFGIELPRLAAQQRDAMPGVRTAVTNLKPGDLVAWRDGSHVAIYAGDGYIIQAANPNQGVIRSKLTNQVGYTPNSVIGIALRLPGE